MTSSLSKVFERLLPKHIVELLHNERGYSKTQFCFRNNHSTIDALLCCTESFRLAVDHNKIITAALLDLSKAFDSIKHKILKEKLISMNFSENAVELPIDFIKDRRQQTIVNNVKSNRIKLYQGVPQGKVLGPLLFNLYINGLSKNKPNNCRTVQYSDDNLLFTEHENLKQCLQNLEESCKLVHQYFKIHSRNLNAEKTELIGIIEKKKHQQRFN